LQNSIHSTTTAVFSLGFSFTALTLLNAISLLIKHGLIQLLRSTRSEGNWVDTFALICVKQIARGISHQQGRFYVSLEGLLGSWRKEGFLPAYLALLKRVG
jgi:hypothetical protein